MPGSHDQSMWSKIDAAPGCAVAWYLMAAYLYYAHDVTIITDGAFDKLARWLLENWWLVEDHPHAHLISQEDLECGTLITDYEGLPNITKDSAWRLYAELSQHREECPFG